MRKPGRQVLWIVVGAIGVFAFFKGLYRLQLLERFERQSPVADGIEDRQDAAKKAQSPGREEQKLAPPQTLEELSPQISLLGDLETVPVGLRLSFAQAVYQGRAPALDQDTSIVIDPAVEGEWRYDAKNALRFTPKKHFAFATKYTVRLESLKVMGHKVTAERGVAREFKTPMFQFVKARLISHNEKSGAIKVQFDFSGAVRAAELGELINEENKLKFAWRSGSYAHQIIGSAVLPEAIIAAEGGTGDGSIVVKLPPGITASGQALTLGQEQLVKVSWFAGPGLDIKKVKLKEGTGNHYIEVICDDLARRGEQPQGGANQIYYWDEDSGEGGYISDSCIPDDETAKKFIRTVPAAAYTISPLRGGFRLLGDFKAGELLVELNAGMKTASGATLKGSIATNYIVPPLSPQVKFAFQGRYLSRKKWESLALRHLNTSAVVLKARIISRDNLNFWLGADSEAADDRNSYLLAQREVKVRGAQDVYATTWFDLKALVNPPPAGVIELQADIKNAIAKGERRRILITDMNIIAKRSDGGRRTDVWVLDIDSLKPLSKVKVRLVKASGFKAAECETTDSGHCQLVYDPAQDIDRERPPIALIAELDKDISYLRFKDVGIDAAANLPKGRAYAAAASPYRAAIWSDRGVYRPGEMAHISMLVRDDADRPPRPEQPFELQLLDPRDKTIRRKEVRAQGGGYIGFDWEIAQKTTTGKYRVVLLAAGRELGRYQFNVEEYVPERLRVQVKGTPTAMKTGQEATLTVSASYLFGGSVEGSRVEMLCETYPSVFKPKENANFHYSLAKVGEERPTHGHASAKTQGKLDGNGQVVLKCPSPEPSLGKGSSILRARAVVFEGESGRSTQAEVDLPLHPDHRYLGLQSGQDKLKAGETLRYSGIVVDWNGQIVAEDGEVDVELVSLNNEWNYGFGAHDGHGQMQRHLRHQIEERVKIAVKDGRFSGEFKLKLDAAHYLVRAERGLARTELVLQGSEDDFFWWSYGENTVEQTPKPLKPEWLDLSELATPLKRGDELRVSFTAPYSGKVLLSVETDKLKTSEWREVKAGKVDFSYKLSEFFPNVYVSALLLKDPHLESKDAFLPDRAFGAKSYSMEPEDFRQTLQISVPGEVKPQTTLKVGLSVGPKAEGQARALVAVVDEGILSLTRFQSPDPLRRLFEARALGIETYETIGWNLSLPKGSPQGHTGGDGGGGRPSQPVIKPVALWSGIVPLTDGKGEVSFRLPQYNGKLRVMAVSFDDQRVGAAEAAVLVRDSFAVSSTLPRFLSPGDVVQIPVSISNLKGRAAKLKLKMALADEPSAQLAFIGPAELGLDVAMDKTETAVFALRALDDDGTANLQVEVEGEEFRHIETWAIPLRPAHAQTASLVKLVANDQGLGQIRDLSRGFRAGSLDGQVWLTSNPYADSLSHLSTLLRYPYGCLEQTTSTLRPLLVLRDLVDGLPLVSTSTNDNADGMVLKGIERLLSMQTASGGFGYWPGDEQASPWGTAYATHVLLEALEQNYPVPRERVDEAVQYLERQVTHGFRFSNLQDQGEPAQVMRGARAYTHYVLARAGKFFPADSESLLAAIPSKNKSPEAAEDEYLLMAALHLSGDQRYEGQLKRADWPYQHLERQPSFRFFSVLRGHGVVLNTFTDLFANDGAGLSLADAAAERLRAQPGYWYTTQELSWLVTALGRRVRAHAPVGEAVITIDKKEHKSTRKGMGGVGWDVATLAAGQDLSLKIDDPAAKSLYLVANIHGIPKNVQNQAQAKGLKITRRYHYADGSPLQPGNGVKLGELVLTSLTVSNTSGLRQDHIALVDRLPASLEIENPRLGRGTALPFVGKDDLWNIEHFNIRDDRIEFFGKLGVGESRSYWHASRAVLAGQFKVPPVKAEAMYAPETMAVEPGDVFVVKGPWPELVGP